MRKHEIDSITKSVIEGLEAKAKAKELETKALNEQTHCKLGLTKDDVDSLKEFTCIFRQSKKTVKYAIIKLIIIGIIGGLLFLIGDKTKTILIGLGRLFQ